MTSPATYDQMMAIPPPGYPQPGYPPPHQPKRSRTGRWVFAGLVLAGLTIAAAIVATRGGIHATTTAPSAPSFSASASCTAWRDAQPRLATVPTPTGGDWRPTSPGGLSVVTNWSKALTPILDDMDQAAQQGGPAADLLARYVTAQRDGLGAAWAGQYGAAQIGEVKTARAALDAACGP